MKGIQGCGERAGFSLVELLVVCLVISVLAMMLLPALLSARSKARESVCWGRLRQWGIGMGLYADDHDGDVAWEGSREDPDRPDAWYNGVSAYLGQEEWSRLRELGREVRGGLQDSVYVCPGSPKRPDVRPYWGYGMNFMLINTRGAYGLPARGHRRLGGLPRVSQVVLMTDKGATPDELKSHPTANPRYDCKSYWHRGGGNVLFGDGHCAWYVGERLLDAFQTHRDRLDSEIIWVPDAVMRE